MFGKACVNEIQELTMKMLRNVQASCPFTRRKTLTINLISDTFLK